MQSTNFDDLLLSSLGLTSRLQSVSSKMPRSFSSVESEIHNFLSCSFFCFFFTPFYVSVEPLIPKDLGFFWEGGDLFAKWRGGRKGEEGEMESHTLEIFPYSTTKTKVEGEGGGGQRLTSLRRAVSSSLRASVVLAIFSKMPPCIFFRFVIYLTHLKSNKKCRFYFTIAVFYTTVLKS